MAPKDGTKGYSKGKNGDGLSRAAQEEVSRTLGRILRYEKSSYSLDGPDGWVELDELLVNCKSQLKSFSRSEVLWVAQTSQGSKGPRFEVDPSNKWLRARYKHDQSGQSWGERGEKGDKGKGKGGKGKSEVGVNAGKANNGNDGSNGGWENYQGVGSSNEENGWNSRPPWQNGHGNLGDGEDPWQKSDPWQKPQNSWKRYEKEKSEKGEDEKDKKDENVQTGEQNASHTYHAYHSQNGQNGDRNASHGHAAHAAHAASGYSSAAPASSEPKETHGSAPHGSAPRPVPPVPPVPLASNGNLKQGDTGAQSFDISTPRTEGETWEKYTDPNSERIWLYHPETQEFFYEDIAQHRGWEKYSHPRGNWWHHDDTGRWFFDPILGA